ncbi:MAG TPA: tetratricopeptide repeat protein [Ktedonobacteraceae bacterium]|nr:tetratricopeptide repeat protein [Ktedonobacteraceae bacterium]
MSGPLARTRWNIPYQRNPFFTGREDILSGLGRALHTEQRVALSQPLGISGLGGIGKTQTVVEYAYRHREEYDAVLWVRADSVTSLASGMVELAQILELPERNELDQDIIVQAVLRWLRLHSDWLLIYDNIDDLSLVEPFLPKAGAGHLLFTTRAHALGGLAQRLDIQQMEPEIGALLLLRRASLLTLQATLNMANPEEQRLAQIISQELDGLPLALDQAGAYIKETPCSLPDYLTHYQTHRSDILRVRGNADQDYPASVATTWSLSFEKIRQAHPAALELLNFCAFLAPDAIPEELLTTGFAHLGEILAPMVAHPLQFDQICQEVLRFSLLQRGADERTFTIHRLVQAVQRDRMEGEAQRQWAERVIQAVDTAFPDNPHDIATWFQCQRYLNQAQVCNTLIEQYVLPSHKAASLLNRTGVYLTDTGLYTIAEPLHVRALAIHQQVLGSTHPDTIKSMNNLGSLYMQQTRYSQAEPLFLQALAIRQQQPEAMHLDIAQSFHHLGCLYNELGRHKEAERMFQMALDIYEPVLGPEHPDTVANFIGLGWIYMKQGRFSEAESPIRKALETREQSLGPTHPTTADTLDALGWLYWHQGKYQEAELLYKRALDARKKTLEPGHPVVAQNLLFLALVYRDQGKYEEAEALCEQALTIYKQGDGLGSLDMGKGFAVYALLLLKRRKLIKATQTGILALRTLGLMVTLRYIKEMLRVFGKRVVWKRQFEQS